MKQIILIYVAIVAFASCKPKEHGAFTVSGRVDNAPNQTVVYLAERPFAEKPIVIDSTKLKDGKFELRGMAKEEGVYALVFPELNREITLVNDAKSIRVGVDLNNFKSYTTEGSKASTALHDLYTNFEIQYKKFVATAQALDTASEQKQSDSALTILIAEKKQQLGQLKNVFVSFINTTESPASCLHALAIARQSRTMDEQEFVQLATNAAKRFKTYPGMQKLNQMLNQMLNEQQYSLLNQTAPEIALPTPAGDTVKLSSLRGKYVLVDFWASWCGPCRKENPNVVAAYNKFKDKNFTVFGVSLDDDKAAWKDAIAADKLTWTHVSDLKRWESALVGLYKFDGIPFNVLVDPNGKIIASGLREEALENKLAELLK